MLSSLLDLYSSFFIFDLFEYLFYPFFALAFLVTVPCFIHFIVKR